MTSIRLCRLKACVAMLAVCLGSAAAQLLPPPPPPPPPPQPVDEGPTFTSETREVTLHVSVLDSSDRIIPDIPRTAFHVFEDGLEQQVKLFAREDIPVSMCLLIDISGSMRERQSIVNAAALALVRASNREDEVCIITFSDNAVLEQPFTSNISTLEKAMDRIQPRGSTAMRDAVTAAIDDQMKKHAKHDKRVIVVLTDGNDNSSTVPLEALLRKVRESEVLIYAVGLLSDEDRGEARKAKRALEELAEASGGLQFFPETLAEMHEITPQIAHEIRNQYTLAYTPSNEALDGTFRRVRVDVRGIGRHTVRHRPGYYAGKK
jgi:Ca-activated chloride channel homolog